MKRKRDAKKIREERQEESISSLLSKKKYGKNDKNNLSLLLQQKIRRKHQKQHTVKKKQQQNQYLFMKKNVSKVFLYEINREFKETKNCFKLHFLFNKMHLFLLQNAIYQASDASNISMCRFNVRRIQSQIATQTSTLTLFLLFSHR